MGNQTLKIVIVEDEQSIAEMYKAKLELDGFTVFTASDGECGLEVIEVTRPDLILLDIRMPIMSGDEMLTKLRAEDWGSAIRVIVLTNLSKDEAPSVLRFLSVDRYVVKAHYTPAQITQVAREVLHLPYSH